MSDSPTPPDCPGSAPLEEHAAHSYRSTLQGSKPQHFDNLLIHADNALALEALQSRARAQVDCIYIDPPYNTGRNFDHYEDGRGHDDWLAFLRSRLERCKSLLADNGSIWVSIDDNECHYLKVMLDELFGRHNFVTTIIWQKMFTLKNSARHFSDMHDYILVYAKDAARWQRNLLPRTAELDRRYTNPDGDPRGVWTSNAIQARNHYSQGRYTITSPKGRAFEPPTGTYWRISHDKFKELEANRRIWWGRSGDNIPRIKKFLSEAKQGVVPSTLWTHDEAGSNAEAKTELRRILADTPDTSLFTTPKPEKLLKRILDIATQPGDLVLDYFAGSGTTGAVAHKMGRRWIMAESHEQALSHIIPRMRKIIDGRDPGGVTRSCGWQGGGGYAYLVGSTAPPAPASP